MAKRNETPTNLSIAKLADLLSQAAPETPVTAAMIREDIQRGAPTNADGTLHLIYYAAWLVRTARHGS